MHLVFVNSPLDSLIRAGKVTPVTDYLYYNSAPLGLLYLAAVLERAGEQASVIDAPAEGLDLEATVGRILALQPDAVGFTSTTVLFPGTVELARRVRQALPGLPILLGGRHVTLHPEASLGEGCFDIGVLGEGEATILEIVAAWSGRRVLESIAGLALPTPEAVLITPTRPMILDLDSLPFPAQHLLPPERYLPVPVDENGLPKLTMLSSRGCPHRCVFCQGGGSAFRSHSTGRVVDEMEHLVESHGAQDIAFIDSLFCASKARVMAICDEILRRRLRVRWTCSGRVDVVDPELLTRMHQAGCWRIRYGIESGSDRVLASITKRIDRAVIRRAVAWTEQAGIRSKGFFIIGHLVDSAESIHETIDFACSLALHDVTVQLNTMMVGTPQAEVFAETGNLHGRMAPGSMGQAEFWSPHFVPWGLDPEDLVQLQRLFYRRFYLRPATVRRHLRSIRTRRDLARYLEGGRLSAHLALGRQGQGR